MGGFGRGGGGGCFGGCGVLGVIGRGWGGGVWWLLVDWESVVGYGRIGWGEGNVGYD